MKTINDRMKLAREEAGFNLSELAKKCGCTPQSVQQWEKGSTKNPSAAHVLSTARATGFRFEWLITGKGPERTVSHGISEPSAGYSSLPREVGALLNLVEVRAVEGSFTADHAAAVAKVVEIMTRS